MKRANHRPEAVAPAALPDVAVSDGDLVRSLCLPSLYEFLKVFWEVVVQEPLVDSWHIRAMCAEAQAVAERVMRGEEKHYDLVCNISPGTSKSSVFSIMLPAWMLANKPSCRVICASYTATLAQDLSMKCRDVIESDLYRAAFPEVKLREDQNTKMHYRTTAGGERYAVGVDGSVLGKHADLIIIDDPLDPNQAASVLDLQKANRWIKDTLSTRKTNKLVTATILVMQRLHQDDPTQSLLDRGGCRHLCLPAELTEDVSPKFYRKFYNKKLMDPHRLGRKVLDQARQNGEAYYAGQFLQNPTPSGGAMFDVTKLEVMAPPFPLPDSWREVRAWDKAGSTGRQAAWTVGVKVGYDGHKIFVLDVKRARMDYYARERMIEDTAEADGKDCLIVFEQEGASGGKESVQSSVARLVGYEIEVLTVGGAGQSAEGDKVKRAIPASVQVSAGNVRLCPSGKDTWHKAFVEELRLFPLSRYKDQVDALAHAVNTIRRAPVVCGGIR